MVASIYVVVVTLTWIIHQLMLALSKGLDGMSVSNLHEKGRFAYIVSYLYISTFSAF
jgi:hypothetical protein